MTIEANPSSRIQVRGLNELLAPASCAICGSGNNTDGYLDCGIFIEWLGQIYMCWTCTDEIVQRLTGFSLEEIGSIKGRTDSLNARLNELTKVAQNYDKLVSSVRTLVLSDPDLISAAGLDASTKPAVSREHHLSNDEPTISRSGEGSKSTESDANVKSFDLTRSTGSDERKAQSESKLGL